VIEYGLALLALCALCLMDRRALPFALILLSGWLLGFLPVEFWPLISIASGTAMILFLNHRSPFLHWLIVCCVPPMLYCDAVYFWMLSRGVYFGVEYANTLNAFLWVQMMACGFTGGKRLVGFVGRLGRYLRNRSRFVVGVAGAKEQTARVCDRERTA